jgi:hypothetical protein
MFDTDEGSETATKQYASSPVSEMKSEYFIYLCFA